jgi:leucyl aminopeptidase (aminopeptidase T)
MRLLVQLYIMYTPSPKILKKYADVLIKFALWSGRGAQKGDVVFVMISESARPLLPHLQRSIMESGAHMMLIYCLSTLLSRATYVQGSV